MFSPEGFLTYGSVSAAVVAVGAAFAKSVSSRSGPATSMITINRPDGSRIELNTKGTTPEEVERLVAALAGPSPLHKS